VAAGAILPVPAAPAPRQVALLHFIMLQQSRFNSDLCRRTELFFLNDACPALFFSNISFEYQVIKNRC
jgi:hypothetical protein